METAKDILTRRFSAKTIRYPGWAAVFPMENEAMMSVIQEIADKAWEAATEHADECYCGKCSYCLEVRDDPAPDKSTFMKSLFPDTK